MVDLPALKKLSGTVDTVVKLAEGVSHFDERELNAAEDRVRNEFQVIEAHLFYVGQEFYNLVQARRQELRRKSMADARDMIATLNKPKEEDGTRSIGGPSDGKANQPARSKRESDTKTSRPARRPRRKKSA